MNTVYYAGDSNQGCFALPAEDKFIQITDLGSITTSKGYWWSAAIPDILKTYPGLFQRFDNKIKNRPEFLEPSRILDSNDVLRVCVCQQVVDGITNFSDRLDFLMRHRSVQPGLPGLMLTIAQKRSLLRVGSRYTVLDHQERLISLDGIKYIPEVYIGENHNHFNLRQIEKDMDKDLLFLRFSEV